MIGHRAGGGASALMRSARLAGAKKLSTGMWSPREMAGSHRQHVDDAHRRKVGRTVGVFEPSDRVPSSDRISKPRGPMLTIVPTGESTRT